MWDWAERRAAILLRRSTGVRVVGAFSTVLTHDDPLGWSASCVRFVLMSLIVLLRLAKR